MTQSPCGSNHGEVVSAFQPQKLATDLRRIVWSKEAIASLEHIVDYIEVFDPDAASRLAMPILDVADTMTIFPDRGRPVANGLREIMTLVPYVIRYRVIEKGYVEILRISHSALGES
jgi:toxin ParE1/3/4